MFLFYDLLCCKSKHMLVIYEHTKHIKEDVKGDG